MKDLLTKKIEDINIKYKERINICPESIKNEKFTPYIKDTRDGKKTILLKSDDKEIFLFSKYNVDKEIERFLNELNDINTESVIVVFGFGLGYHIKKLFEKLSKNNKVIIIEPSIKVFNEAIENKDIEEIFNDNTNFNIIVGEDVEEVEKYFYQNINGNNLNNIHFCTFGQYGNIFSSYENEILRRLKDIIVNGEVNLATEYYFQYEFSSNVIKNIPYLLESESVGKLEGKFEGYPAIIVSAGPSLDKNLHKLKKAQGKAVIISGGRTLKPLLKNGITPTFVVSIDPGYAAYKLVEDYLDCEIPLISMPLSNHDIMKKYKGKHYIINNNAYSQFINKILSENAPGFVAGGSVAHTSTVLAHYMGCNPIILIGQDLAFTDQKKHSEQANFEGKENDVKEGAILVEDIYGGKVYTSKPLFSFLKWFEKYFETNNNIKFIDATEGGAKIKGTEICTLDEAINKYCNKELDIFQELTAKSAVSEESYKKAHKIMLDTLEDMDCMKENLEKGLKLLDKAYAYYKKGKKININKVFKQLDDTDNIIKEKEESSALLTSAVVPSIRKINLDKELLEKAYETEIEKGLRVVKKNKILYKGILDSINIMKPLIQESANIIKEKTDS